MCNPSKYFWQLFLTASWKKYLSSQISCAHLFFLSLRKDFVLPAVRTSKNAVYKTALDSIFYYSVFTKGNLEFLSAAVNVFK